MNLGMGAKLEIKPELINNSEKASVSLSFNLLSEFFAYYLD